MGLSFLPMFSPAFSCTALVPHQRLPKGPRKRSKEGICHKRKEDDVSSNGAVGPPNGRRYHKTRNADTTSQLGDNSYGVKGSVIVFNDSKSAWKASQAVTHVTDPLHIISRVKKTEAQSLLRNALFRCCGSGHGCSSIFFALKEQQGKKVAAHGEFLTLVRPTRQGAISFLRQIRCG